MKKVRDIRSEIVQYTGDTVTLKLFDELDVEKAKEIAVKGRHFAYIDLYEKDTITDLQRDHFYALVGDIFEYTGIPKEIVEDDIKYMFMNEYRLDEVPSLKRGAMKKTVASDLISFVIDFCIQNGIPFRKQQFYLTTDTSHMIYALTMKRICVVCGKEHGALHHVEAVGMGRDRTRIDHTQHSFLMLCSEHHREVHSIGYLAFCKKYFVKAVKLTTVELKKLNIQGKYKEDEQHGESKEKE